ncbi:MAG: coenzyme F420-0:L-glutamate ligase/coenzyme F420-1:gamma-L-glutamate ligase [Gammaproteobacteria bacterium]|jgi:coenzyme F420-0:L-glutamate ligase/coenzyme F420-1:gamma-L-glutamate ligase
MSGLSLSLNAVSGIPLIKPGDDLPEIIFKAIDQSQLQLSDNDIVVVAQKIVSKAENRIIDLATVIPGDAALVLAKQADKDPRLVELILQESREVVRCKEGVIIVEHRSGIVMANAGIDHSNVGDPELQELVTLLPEDANISAANLRQGLEKLSGKKLGIIINDSVGRAWRIGTVGIAIGSSGVLPLKDLRGEVDLFGQVLRVSETADADALACAACILMGEANDASPVVIIRGHQLSNENLNTNMLVRNKEEDMFR